MERNEEEVRVRARFEGDSRGFRRGVKGELDNVFAVDTTLFIQV